MNAMTHGALPRSCSAQPRRLRHDDATAPCRSDRRSPKRASRRSARPPSTVRRTCSTTTPGNLVTSRQVLKPDFATITPGMSSQEVLVKFGPPTWTFGVRQENMTIWNYRYYHGDCIIYQVSMLPNGTVRDAGTGWDPRCDGPNGRP